MSRLGAARVVRVAVIGAGYVGLTTAACFAHLGHDVVCADLDAERVAAPEEGRGADPRARPSGAHQGRPPDRPSRVRGRRGHGRAPRRDRLSLRADAPGRRRLGRPVVRRERRPRDRAGARARDGRRQQVDGAGGFDPLRAADPLGIGRSRRGRHRRVEPRVPPRGSGRSRLPQSGPDRHRLRRPPVGRARQRALQACRRPGPRHRPGLRRDDQVRVERVPRDEGVVHQRDRESVRSGRRRRA